jgi:hypothetical protein
MKTSRAATTFKPFQNLLRSAACIPAVLEMLMYVKVHSASCAPAACNLRSLATVLNMACGYLDTSGSSGRPILTACHRRTV